MTRTSSSTSEVRSMGMKEIVKEYGQELDKPLPDVPLLERISLFKKGKIKFVIHFEDGSYRDYYKKMKDDYGITISDHYYLVVPKYMTFGKYPTMDYYYNNPMPIALLHESTKFTAAMLQEKKDRNNDGILDKRELQRFEEQKDMKANVYIDARALKVAFNSNLINKMYAENKVPAKVIIVIVIVAIVALIVILQLTGKIDIFGFLAGKKGP